MSTSCLSGNGENIKYDVYMLDSAGAITKKIFQKLVYMSFHFCTINIVDKHLFIHFPLTSIDM